jgi:hypothetical protein
MLSVIILSSSNSEMHFDLNGLVIPFQPHHQIANKFRMPEKIMTIRGEFSFFAFIQRLFPGAM